MNSNTLDAVDEAAEKVALGFVLFLVGLMVICVVVMMYYSWLYLVQQGGLVGGTLMALIVWGISGSVAWTGARNR